jgi:hypothetical protein
MARVFGYVFLIAGLGLMFYGLYDGYSVFKGKKTPPAVFKKEISPKGAVPKIDVPVGGQNIKVPLSGFEGLLPDFTPLMNLTVEFFLITIFLSAGHKIASLGIGLIKK